MIISKPGFYDLDALVYHSDPAPMPSLNQSLIPTLLDRSPYHAAFRSPRLNPYGHSAESSLAQYLGEAAHRIALGRGREISTIRYRDYRDSSARAARDEAVRNRRIPVLESELIKARAMAKVIVDAIKEECGDHPYETEVAMFWIEETPFGPVWARAMIDVLCRPLGLILDPKCLRTPAVPEAFGKKAGEFGYDVQSSWYTRGAEALIPDLAGRVKFKNIVVESFEPHGVGIFEADAETRAVADMDVEAGISLWGQCVHSRKWPSYTRKSQTYSTPNWRQNRSMERSASAYEA